MGRKRLRPALFPGCPLYLTFIGGVEEYDEGSELPEELVGALSCTLAEKCSPSILEMFARLCGLNNCITWGLSQDLAGRPGPVWDHVIVCDKGHPISFRTLGAGVKINRFPNTAAVCRKDRLLANYTAMQKKHGKKAFNFIPKAYQLPEEEKILKWKMKQKKEIWIVKPPADSCGKGIRLVTEPEDVLDSRLVLVEWHDPRRAIVKLPQQNLIVQKYITNPFLVNGLKFDLRLYVLLTSIDPIKLYLYNDGLVRFATQPFTIDENDLGNNFIHLTNYAINKNSEEFIQNENPSEFEGHKWSLKTFWRYLESQGRSTKNLWKKIGDIVSKTIVCGHEGLLQSFKTEAESDYSCYKIFGIDIFLDDKMKPWLLEFNSFPSLCEPTLDRHVNEPMLAEAFNMAGFHLTGKLKPKQKQQIKERYKLSEGVPIEFDKRLYDEIWEEEEEEKEADEWEYDEDTESFDGKDDELVAEENLGGKEVRLLVRYEEEMSQSAGFERLIPETQGSKFLKYLQKIGSSDRLLAAWESKYGQCREKGRALLTQLCQKGIHLEHKHLEHLSMKSHIRRVPKHIITC